MGDSFAAENERNRIDRWLWSVRLFKTRSDAAEACRSGLVTIGDQEVKPARNVRAGDVIVARQGLIRRTAKVLGIPASRIGAKLVSQYAEDITPPEDYAAARAHRAQHIMARPAGAGRPTKKERRELDDFFEQMR